ncbi:hypothetical protein GTR02_20700 [Kineococcus sp. R8]|uniref:hypothetical protein n=1 Tax=Kineococcus siccus TaxID=2696567 RepID=UPI0014133078|nr:hypothetical protein [Kineococcus siccus]NAZ84227.1 hypothetical protein [Kineococcus siccus]
MTNPTSRRRSCARPPSLPREAALTVLLALLVTAAWSLGVHPVLGGALTGAVVGGTAVRLVRAVRADRTAAPTGVAR